MTATYTDLTLEQRTFYELEMLDRAVPNFVHLAMGQTGVSSPTSLPENSGDVIDWRKLGAFSVVTTALSDGVTPDAQDIAITHVTATVAEYGAYVKYSRKLAQFGIDRVAAEAADALGEQAGDSLDQLVRNVVVAGSTVQFASTAANRGEITAAMKLSAAEILEALATLKINKARPIADGKFYAVIHPYTEYDLYQDTVFQAIFNYAKDRGDTNPWALGYVGDALGVRFFVSPNAREWVDEGLTNADVFCCMVFGRNSFGIGGLAQYMPATMNDLNTVTPEANHTGEPVKPLRLIQKGFGSAGTADPIDQRASIAWYTTFTTARLQETFMVRIEHGTALGS